MNRPIELKKEERRLTAEAERGNLSYLDYFSQILSGAHVPKAKKIFLFLSGLAAAFEFTRSGASSSRVMAAQGNDSLSSGIAAGSSFFVAAQPLPRAGDYSVTVETTGGVNNYKFEPVKYQAEAKSEKLMRVLPEPDVRELYRNIMMMTGISDLAKVRLTVKTGEKFLDEYTSWSGFKQDEASMLALMETDSDSSRNIMDNEEINEQITSWMTKHESHFQAVHLIKLPEYRRDVAAGYCRIGNFFLTKGRFKNALTLFEAAVSMLVHKTDNEQQPQIFDSDVSDLLVYQMTQTYRRLQQSEDRLTDYKSFRMLKNERLVTHGLENGSTNIQQVQEKLKQSAVKQMRSLASRQFPSSLAPEVLERPLSISDAAFITEVGLGMNIRALDSFSSTILLADKTALKLAKEDMSSLFEALTNTQQLAQALERHVQRLPEINQLKFIESRGRVAINYQMLGLICLTGKQHEGALILFKAAINLLKITQIKGLEGESMINGKSAAQLISGIEEALEQLGRSAQTLEWYADFKKFHDDFVRFENDNGRSAQMRIM